MKRERVIVSFYVALSLFTFIEIKSMLPLTSTSHDFCVKTSIFMLLLLVLNVCMTVSNAFLNFWKSPVLLTSLDECFSLQNQRKPQFLELSLKMTGNGF